MGERGEKRCCAQQRERRETVTAVACNVDHGQEPSDLGREWACAFDGSRDSREERSPGWRRRAATTMDSVRAKNDIYKHRNKL